MLRFMAWLCLKDNALSGSQMCIVTGPRIDLAIALIERMKKVFVGSNKGPATAFDTKETVI
jgi:late competence protein required for DNA uptake (superfamily II DNA/RNA helicase)